jgi:hypothetical protein
LSHDTHTKDDSIRELEFGATVETYRMMAKGWKDPFPEPVVEAVSIGPSGHVLVVRDDLQEMGSKARFGSLMVQKMKEDTIVYVAPRVGWAPISLAKLCKLYGKRLILFAPASKEASDHQRVAVELGAEMRFHRIAAMPVLQSKAAEFADKHGYLYAPLGLRHPLVTAAIVATADRITKKLGSAPEQVWSAMSTGVLSRGLQLAWPDAEFHGVAVARNIKAGERGRAIIHSHPLPFLQDERKEFRPPFPSASNYDAKVWRYMVEDAVDGALFWNVAGEILPTKPNKLKSDVPWKDESAFKRK